VVVERCGGGVCCVAAAAWCGEIGGGAARAMACRGAAAGLGGGMRRWAAPRWVGAGMTQHRRWLSTSQRGFASAVPAVDPATDDGRFVGLTGAQIFHELMRDHGVDTVFGYPGGAILPVFDAIYQSEYFKFILSRHEQGAGFMAEGYARATGKPGIVLVTSGPGATNTVTPLMDAMMDGTPLIVFTGQVPTAAIGTDAFQEADVVGITRACTKWNVLVKSVDELPRRINEAFEIAMSGRPGPVLVDLPKDVTAVELKKRPDSRPHIAVRMKQKVDIFHKGRVGAPGASEFKHIAELVNNAKRPIIYAGQGVMQSPEVDGPAVLKEFAEKANIPVTTSLQGMGSFDERSPLSLKMLGMHGSAYANYSIQAADLILAVGARFDDRVTGRLDTFAPEARRAEKEGRGGIVHFEISPKNMHKVVEPTIAVLGDAASNLQSVTPFVRREERQEWFDQIDAWKKAHPFAFEKSTGDEVLKPQQVISELNQKLLAKNEADGTDYYISTGVGSHQMWTAQYITWTKPRQCITSGGAGSMGYGVPSAIGAKIAKPNAIVIDIDGDASFCMTLNELLTDVQFNIGAKYLVLNNNFQGMVGQWQTLFYEKRYSGTEMVNPRFDKMAQAMGVKGIYCDKEADLSKALDEFINYNDGPVLLEVFVDRAQHVFPMVPAGGSLSQMILGDEPAPEKA